MELVFEIAMFLIQASFALFLLYFIVYVIGNIIIWLIDNQNMKINIKEIISIIFRTK